MFKVFGKKFFVSLFLVAAVLVSGCWGGVSETNPTLPSFNVPVPTNSDGTIVIPTDVLETIKTYPVPSISEDSAGEHTKPVVEPTVENFLPTSTSTKQ